MFLAIETSHPRASLALFDRGGVHVEDTREGSEHAREIAVSIAVLLERAGLKVPDLRGVAVGRGPGSYTGCRVAVTTAKSIAFARRLPILVESSLAILAEGARSSGSGVQPGDRVRPVLDARRGSLFSALFEVERDGIRRLEEDRVLAADELARHEESSWLVGGGAELLLERLELAGRAACGLVAGVLAPRARDLAVLCGPRLESARFDLEAIHALAPAYLQPSRPEILREEAALRTARASAPAPDSLPNGSD